MAGKPGADFKLFDGTGTSTVAVGAQRSTSFTLNRGAPEVTNKDSPGLWRELLASAGIVSLDIQCEGILDGGTAYQALRGRVISGAQASYTLAFDGGDTFAGPFRITQIEEAGAVDGEQTYKMTLMSAGSLAYGTT